MAEVLTKFNYARRLGVKPHAVSMWISRGKLVPPALRSDGKVDVALADEQLGVTLDPVRHAGAISRTDRESQYPPSAAGGEIVDFGAGRDLVRAKALMAQISAERARRELQAEIGRYVLADDAEAEWARVLGEFLRDVEISLADVALELGLSRDQLVKVRAWWRQQRASAAAKNRAAAAAAPEFVEDGAVKR